MAFRIIRQRKEARRNAKLDEIFEERDKSGSGYINYEQLEEIYRIYQVDLDDTKAHKMLDTSGTVSREDFIQFAKETHLLDFECSAMGEAILLLSPRRTRKHPQPTKKSPVQKNKPESSGERDKSCSMLACFCSDKKVEELLEEKMDKVEFAFRKFDSDGDGFLSWEEFQQLVKNLDQEQALRIFHSCNQSGTGLVSLDEFRAMVNRKHDMTSSEQEQSEQEEQEESVIELK